MQPLRRIVQELAVAGYQLERSAYDYLQEMNEFDAARFVRTLLASTEDKASTGAILTRQKLQQLAQPELKTWKPTPSVATTIPAKQISPSLRVQRDPSKEIGTGGSMEDFSNYFRDRFRKMTGAFQHRQETRDATTLGIALKAAQNAKVKTIVMVMEKRERQGKLFLEVDDIEDSATILVAEQDREAYDTAQKVPLDQVICVSGVRAKGDLLVAKQVLLPDIPDHKPRLA